MMEGLFMLLVLSTVMAIASFLAGSLPLSFSLSQNHLRMVASIGMGVLVGTSLIVIIPEGVETLYGASDYSNSISRRHLPEPRHAIVDFFPLGGQATEGEIHPTPTEPGRVGILGQPGPAPPPPPSSNHDDIGTDPSQSSKKGLLADTRPKDHETPTGIARPHVSHTPFTSEPSSLAAEKIKTKEPHAWVGLSLILGFILMYFLDNLASFAPPPTSRQSSNIYSLSDLSSSPTATPIAPSRSFSTTLGLCIHAAADGIALGASSSSSTTTSLSFIIFFAIMVHKAPAAFGLTSVLLKQGLGKRGTRAHLIIFSLAAPVGAVATWLLIRALGGGDNEPAVMRWWTGVLLLFSGGTFLYVAMHTMQEEDVPDEISQTNGYLGQSPSSSRRQARETKNPRMVGAAIAGMLLPLVTQIGHAH